MYIYIYIYIKVSSDDCNFKCSKSISFTHSE